LQGKVDLLSLSCVVQLESGGEGDGGEALASGGELGGHFVLGSRFSEINKGGVRNERSLALERWQDKSADAQTVRSNITFRAHETLQRQILPRLAVFERPSYKILFFGA
jgi:hypothetical protein